MISPRRRFLLLALCLAASLWLYFFVPGLIALLSSVEPSFSGEVFPWLKNASIHTLPEMAFGLDGDTRFLCCCAALFVIYGCVFRLVKGVRSLALQTAVFVSGALMMLWQVFSPVMLSTDVYAYAFYGRVLSLYGANAYVNDIHVSSDPFLTLFGHDFTGSVYGPLWTLISACITRFTGDHIGLTVLAFRLLSICAALAVGALIWAALRIHAPERAAQGLALFVWNPLVIMEAGIGAHNDTTMIAFALLGVWLHLRGWKSCAAMAFTLSALVKFLTGMLVPLYVLMVLRTLPDWKSRGRYLIKTAAFIGVAAAAVVFLSRVKTDVPVGPYATAPDFYSNNFHELIFKALRRSLGEDAESVQVPVYFGSWWLITELNADIHTAPDDSSPVVTHIPKPRKLLVIAPHLDDWLRIYDPVTRKKGYISEEKFADTVPDDDSNWNDPVLERLEDAPVDWPSVIKANHWIRIATWGLFAAFGLVAAWRTRDFDRFLFWAATALLVSYFLIMTQMWPWYVIWSLAFGALNLGKFPARLAVLLSMGVCTLYVTIGYAASGDDDWIYTYRSIPAVVIPAALFLVGTLLMRFIPNRYRQPDALAEVSA